MVKKKTITKTTKKRATRKSSNLVDYYPNRMTVAVSVLAGTSLMLFSLLAALTINNR